MESKEISWQQGRARPLGVSQTPEGLNFALFSEAAKEVTLCLFNPGEEKAFAEIKLDPRLNRTGQIWHVFVKNLPEKVEYGYSIPPQKLLLDPYAKSISSSSDWGKKEKFLRGRALTQLPFDWKGDTYPRIPMEELVIYEMHVRAFTQHPSSRVKQGGTYQGIIEKIPYLLELGVNAIELMPIHAFDELDNPHTNPFTHQPLCNFWGYSPLNYFALMNRYSTQSEWGEEIQQFKEMVRELHRAGIEVILDVVYNHTGEGFHKTIAYRGIDEKTYYMHAPDGHMLDFTGCGNTLNCNQPIVTALILDSLHYCVSELHIDGFRFDLASIFTRDLRGQVLADPPLIRAITNDPLLTEIKLIAEAWDAAGLYQVGHFPGGPRWAQWNGRYRDVVRRFIRGTDKESGSFASVLSGSEDLFSKGNPSQSINFVTAHDGFTLRDLVSYEQKHNEENGEKNRDGLSWNDSWNCGKEGETDDPAILALRERQMRNFLLALFVSLGTPMLLMGDEYGHTRNGNNNAYCQDNEKNYFLWEKLQSASGLHRFIRLLIKWRKHFPYFKRCTFFNEKDVIWHGKTLHTPDWSEENRLVAYQLKADSAELYIAFNAHPEPSSVQLPPGEWKRLVDTSLSSPEDIFEDAHSAPTVKESLQLAPYSAIMLTMLAVRN